MNLAEFEALPTKRRHPVYEDSMLYSTAPEWSTGEVLLAAVYRRLIMGVSESDVDLGNIESVREQMPAIAGGPALWSRLFLERGGISSPLKYGQYSPLASRQLMPLVPSVSRIAGVLGKRPRSRWNPSNLLLETIGTGLGRAAGEDLVRALGESISVTDRDDVFARFLEGALQQGLVGITPSPTQPEPFHSLQLDESAIRAFRGSPSDRCLCPAERFCRDLPHVLALKHYLTRRQWTVLVESMLRIGLGMHVLWVCNANCLLWDLLLDVASGGAPPDALHLEAAIWESHAQSRPLLRLGSDGEPLIEGLIERYAFARTGINMLLCKLEDVGTPWPATSTLGSDSPSGARAPHALSTFLSHLATNRRAIDPVDAGQWLRARIGQLFDDQEGLRELAKCDSGYTNNLFEFVRHSLGQINSKQPEQRCYDLAYLLAYDGQRKPLPVQAGPAMLVTLVHACCSGDPGVPASLSDFREHLSEYGLHAPAGELLEGKTGRDLSMLGLVVDSPDAAGGRLLVPPF